MNYANRISTYLNSVASVQGRGEGSFLKTTFHWRVGEEEGGRGELSFPRFLSLKVLF